MRPWSKEGYLCPSNIFSCGIAGFCAYAGGYDKVFPGVTLGDKDLSGLTQLGKGIAAASLGRLLKQRGLRVKVQKLDPYLNDCKSFFLSLCYTKECDFMQMLLPFEKARCCCGEKEEVAMAGKRVALGEPVQTMKTLGALAQLLAAGGDGHLSRQQFVRRYALPQLLLGGGNPLAQAGHHAAGDENIFDGHKYPSLLHGRIPSREIK